MLKTNPAALLHKSLAQLYAARTDKQKVRDVVAKTFGLNANDDVQVRSALYALDQVFQMAEARIRALDRAQHDFYLRHFGALRSGFAKLNLDLPASSALRFLTEAALENLASAAVRISEDYPEVEVSQAELNDLSSAVDELLTWAASAEFDPDLKEVSLELLEALHRSIFEFRIRGVHGLRRAVEEALGKLSMYRWRKGADFDSQPFERVWNVVVRAEAVLSRALTYGPYLADAYHRLLGAG